MKKIVIALLLVLVSVPALAEIKNCTNALVNAGVCRAQDVNDAFYFDLPDDKMTVLIKKAARMAGFTQNVLCTQALVTDGICTAEQLAASASVPFACSSELIARKLCRQTELAQPLARKDVAYRQIRLYFLNDWIRGEEAQDLRDASDAALTTSINGIPDPDISY
jgi:hypothetical protein